MSKVLQERGSGSLPSSTEMNPRDHVNSISTTVEADTTSIRPLADLGASIEEYARGCQCALDPQKTVFSIAHTKVDMFKRKITLRVGDEKIMFKSVKPASCLIKRVYMLSLRERMDLDLKARIMGETLILNRSLDPLYGDYIELNDLNKPLELRRNRVDDLEPTIEEVTPPDNIPLRHIFGGVTSGVTRPKIDDKYHFELKGQFLKELRDNTFSSSDHEDANEHIEKVLEIVNLFHIPNITQDQIMLRAFPMSLTGVASRWLRNKPSGSIKTWEDLKAKFLSKYCPPARTAKKMEEINNFQQEPDETIYQAWERFKELLRKFHQHYITEMQEVILFYNGLKVLTRQILDFKGVIPNKTAVDAKVAIQEMAEYSQKWDMSYVRDPTTPKTVHLKKKEKPLKKLIILNLVYLSNKEGNIEQQLQDSTKGIMQILRIKSEDNQWKRLLSRASIKALELIIRCLYDDCYDEKKGSYGLKDLDAYSIGTTLHNGSLPKKEKYLGSFTLPCYINNVCFEKALADLGSSASCVEAKRFDGIIIIRDGDDSVTYQMVRANSRFKHLTNEKCNKIPPLLKVSEQDKMNGISHSYQKLKGFYKGVLNLGPEFIRDAKVEEWLIREHISVHEME
ncbi:pyruvate dehydrogenase (acetyl-transferring) kinase, mitochondrial [Tanacetum coccineum]